MSRPCPAPAARALPLGRLATLLAAVAGAPAAAAPAAPPPSPRYRFATLGVGVDAIATFPGVPLMVPVEGADSFGAPLRAGAVDSGSRVPAGLAPRLSIGGLHFWGHADLVVHIPVGLHLPLGAAGDGLPTARLREGVETAARVYPWAIAEDGPRPWAGLSWATFGYRQDDAQDGQGPERELHRVRWQLGLSHRAGDELFELGVGHAPGAPFSAAVSRAADATLDADPWSVHLGWRHLIDTTVGLEKADAAGQTAARRQALTEAGALSGPELGLGLGVVVPTTRSSFGEVDALGFLGDRPGIGLMPDLGAGWYFHRPDLTLRFTARPSWAAQEGYGARRSWTRQSYSADLVKFLTDAHGFVPFVGLGASVEALRFTAEDGGRAVAEAEGQVGAASLVFGWDIRPNDVQSWLLRTNLRYTPGLHLDLSGGGRAEFQQLEIDFIQLVWYPRRAFAG